MSVSDTAFLFSVWQKTLHTSVVIAVSCAAETLDESVFNKFLAEGVACVLAATVAVKNSSVESAVLLTQLFYGVYTEFLLHVVTHFKSNDLAVEAIKNWRNIELSVSTLYLSDISQELLQRRSGSEISFYQILAVLSFSISLCDTVWSAVPVDKARFAHSAIYCPETDMSAFLCKSCLHPSDTVILVVRML